MAFGAREPYKLVGRQKEGHELKLLLSSRVRLICIHGAAGCGKTRLAREIFQNLERSKTQTSLFWCNLSETTDAQNVYYELLSTLGIKAERNAQSHQLELAVARELALLAPVILILDNFEQLIERGAPLISRLLARVPQLQIVVTSREPLGLEEESCYPLEPLNDDAAIELFILCALSTGQYSHITSEDRRYVARIVEYLDRLPLSIVLAASNEHYQNVRALWSSLADSTYSDNTSRILPHTKYLSLESAIEWSWRLLSTQERKLLEHCSIFRGSFSIAAIEEISPNATDGQSVRTVLEWLIRKALVLAVVDERASREALRRSSTSLDAGESRIRLFHSVRDFAAKKLAENPKEQTDIRDRHSRYYLEVAEHWGAFRDASAELENSAFSALEIELPNILTAFEYAQDTPTELAARGLLAAFPLLKTRISNDEQLRLLSAAMQSTGANQGLFARLSLARAEIHRLAARTTEARKDIETALAFSRKLPNDDELLEVDCHHALCAIEVVEGKFSFAEESARLALNLLHGKGQKHREALVLSELGAVCATLGKLEEARDYLEEALEHHSRLGHIEAEAEDMHRLALVFNAIGRPAEAKAVLECALSIHEEVGNKLYEGMDLTALAFVCLEYGQHQRALECCHRALTLHRGLHLACFEAITTLILARIHLDSGQLNLCKDTLRSALALHREANNKRGETVCQLIESLWYMETDALDAALDQLERANENAKQLGDIEIDTQVNLWMSAAYSLKGRTTEAVQRLEIARVASETFGSLGLKATTNILEGFLDLARARVAQHDGQYDEAARLLRLVSRRVVAASTWIRGLQEAPPATFSAHVRCAVRLLNRELQRWDEAPQPPEKQEVAIPVDSPTQPFVLELNETQRRVSFDNGEPIFLGRRRALWKVLWCLAEGHRQNPNMSVPWHTLLEVGWPGEKVSHESGFGRVRTAIWQLRRLGLNHLLVTRDDGYLIMKDVRIQSVS